MFELKNDIPVERLAEMVRDFDHHGSEYRSNSIDILMYLQQHAPFTRSDHYGGFWVATKADDCLTIAKNVEVFSNYPAEVIPALAPELMIPINVDPPELYDYRALLGPMFSPLRAKAHAEYTRAIARDMMTKIVERGEGDLKWDYALPLTGIVTLKIAGLPTEEWRYYAPPLHNLIYSLTPLEERQAAMWVMIERMRAEIRRIKDEPVEGSLITYLHNAEIAGRKVRVDEIDSVILILLGGGLDTTQALFGMASVFLAENPSYRQDLIDHPELMENAIEEFLRVFPPTQGNSRRAKADVVVAGQQVKAEEQVFMSYAAANRDPDEYADPHKVDLRRDNIRHLSFGVGPHRCIGSHIARMELRILLETLIEMAPDYKLVDEGVRLAADIGTIAGFEQIKITV